MENASTNGLPPVAPAGQGVLGQTASAEQRSRFRVSQSERRPSGVANKSAEKIPGFFERIADRFKDWKESRNEAALKRSGRRAVSTITRGLATNDFRKVYQGLKRLHNAEQKLSDMGGTVGALDKKTYISDRLESVASECVPYEKNSSASEKAKILKRFAEDRNNLVDRHSDSKTLFHRMLTSLKRAHLISSSYVGSRTKRIEAQDKKIKASLQSLQSTQVSLLKKKIVDWFYGAQEEKAEQLLENFSSGRNHDSVRIESFKELKGLASEAYKKNFREESVTQSDTYAIYDDDDCFLSLKQHKVNKNDIDFEKIEKEIKEYIDKIELSEKPEEDFFKDYKRNKGQYFLEDRPLIIENEADIEQHFQKEGARVIYGICHQVLPPILFFGHVCHDSTNNKEFSYHFTVDDDKKLLKIDYTYISNMAADLYNNKESILRAFPEDPPLAKSVEFHASLKVEYDDAGRSSVKIDSFDCKYTKFSEALI